MARPSKLDLNALGSAEVAPAPRNSSLLNGPVADALRASAEDGQDRAFTVPEAQVGTLISRIRSTARQLDNRSAKITTVHLTKDKEDKTIETVVKQGTIRTDGRRTIKVYFRVKPVRS